MIRPLLSWLILRSADRARPLPRPVRSAIDRSPALRHLDRSLRDVDARLRASTPGLIDAPSPFLAHRTLAALRPASPSATSRATTTHTFRFILAAVGGLGAVAAAAITAAALLNSTPAAPSPHGSAPIAKSTNPAAPAPNLDPDPALIPEHELAGADPDPSPTFHSDPDTTSQPLVQSVLRTHERAVAAEILSSPYLAEARRLRDDTQAAAGYLLDRLRIIGAPSD